MNAERFHAITKPYAALSIALVGDFCLDRYLEIDSERKEVSIETGLAVHNVVRVRSQPGGAGTILNNLVALGVGEIHTVGFCGEDGEGFELRRALNAMRGVRTRYFVETPERRTFTYCKPLVVEVGKPPVELNRLDSKNWSPTPELVQTRLAQAVTELASKVDSIILLDQVDVAETGVITPSLLDAVGAVAKARPGLLIIADSRRGLRGFPPLSYKMNRAELAALTGTGPAATPDEVKATAATLAHMLGHHVFVTLSEYGLVGASADGVSDHVPCHPLRGPIDVVGAGDAVTANLAAALAAGATMRESLEIANAAASIVVHQLGTTGTAEVEEIGRLLRKA